MHTTATLTQDLVNLGVSPGDVVFVHSSFKSLGTVDGGAGSVVASLEAAVGPDGLVLMPSFSLEKPDVTARAECWDIHSTPSTVGWLTEFFRTMPGTRRSDHYSHSVAARGAGAADFVSGHLAADGLGSPWDLGPWGKTYGTHSPMVRAYDRAGKILMLGVDYHTSTYVHLVEVTYWNRCLETDQEANYLWLDRDRLGEFWDRTGPVARGPVGDAACRLFGIREYVDGLLVEVTRDPDRYDRTAGR
jgi:aminoglycoside 3-N-acetyltransferase